MSDETRDYGGATDEELIVWTGAGEPAAFDELIRRHRVNLHGVARSVVRDDDVACDVVQTAWMKMFEKAHTFKADGSFGGWAYRIVRNEALMHIRRRRRRGEVALDAVREPCDRSAASADSAIARMQLAGMLNVAVEKLAPRYREPFELKASTDMSIVELAEALGLSEGGVKTRLHRARAHLRKTLLRLHGESIFDFIAV